MFVQNHEKFSYRYESELIRSNKNNCSWITNFQLYVKSSICKFIKCFCISSIHYFYATIEWWVTFIDWFSFIIILFETNSVFRWYFSAFFNFFFFFLFFHFFTFFLFDLIKFVLILFQSFCRLVVLLLSFCDC